MIVRASRVLHQSIDWPMPPGQSGDIVFRF